MYIIMKNKYHKEISNKVTQLFYREIPAEFSEYCDNISIFTKINLDNLDNLKEKYLNYLNLFHDYLLKPKPKRLPHNISYLGFYSKTSLNIQYWIDRGFNKIQFNEYLKTRQNTCSVDAKQKKYNCTKEEAIIILNEQTNRQVNTLNNRSDITEINYKKGNSSRKSYCLENKINPNTNLLYTENELKLLFNTRYGWRLNTIYTLKDRLTNNCCIEYWLNKGFSIDDAEQKLSDRQKTFSLETCIAKYGDKLGLIKWQERQDKWQNTLNSKSDEEKLAILIKKISRPTFWSIEAVNFFEELVKDIESIHNLNFKYYYKNNEYFINSNGKFYLYDFTIKDLKLIIEYNGSHVHPNKDKMTNEQWNKWINPLSKENADTCYNKDKHKIDSAKNKGFDVLIVWDNDIKKNKKETKKLLLNHINNTVNILYNK